MAPAKSRCYLTTPCQTPCCCNGATMRHFLSRPVARARGFSYPVLAMGGTALVCISATASAQLRPLEPVPWRVLEKPAIVAGEVGGSALRGQRASLAGVSGELVELANFSVAWRSGIIVLEGAGTLQRLFHDRARFAEPYPDVKAAENDRRHDSGDYRISTIVRFTPESWPATGVLRFGTRLPTTDNTTGLDRDAFDFFATLGVSAANRAFAVSGETGLGIGNTREEEFEQDDLLVYALRVEYRAFSVRGSVTALGQRHGYAHRAIRGVEDLGELRMGLSVGARRWIRVEAVRGYETFSPRSGIIVTAGMLR